MCVDSDNSNYVTVGDSARYVTECPDWLPFKMGMECVQACPQNYHISGNNQCVLNCGAGEALDKMTNFCSGTCLFTEERGEVECVTQCSANYPFEKIIGSRIQCVESCEVGEVPLVSAEPGHYRCVDSCGDTMYKRE